jgi:TldD protein
LPPAEDRSARARAEQALFEAAGLLHGELRTRRSRAWSSASVFAETSNTLTGRYADGTFVEVTADARSGMSIRAFDGTTTRVRAGSTLDTAAVADVLPAPEVETLRALLDEIDLAARRDPEVTQVLIAFEALNRAVATGSLEHDLRLERRDLVYLTVRVVARRRQTVAAGYYTPAVAGAFTALDGGSIGTEAAGRAVATLEARPAPVGRLPVVIAGGRGIVVLHEACCHPLEADEIVRGSVYAGALGRRVATPLVTIVDDPTLEGAVGSYEADDECVPATPTAIVSEGRLSSFLTDRETAARLGQPLTGNGRCASFAVEPQPRMTNTCLLPGPQTADEIVAGTDDGIYAQHVAGGEVVEATGEFVFRVTNGFHIKRGVVCDPIQETTIAGAGPTVLQEIDAVGDDVQLAAAKCGKNGQVLPVGVCGPTIRVRSLLVGGTGESMS